MDRYSELEKTIGLHFENRKLLEQAFVHRSYLNERRDKEIEDNERLEFLGDAVLELIVTEYLYEHYQKPEGILTNWRSALVKGKNLAEIATKLSLGSYLHLSKGEKRSGGEKKQYILANTFEALLGAIYLEKGYKDAKKFVETYVIIYLEEIIAKGLYIDAKSRFQEITQEKSMITPQYRVIEEKGPDHDKVFTVGVYLEERLIAQGVGTSKQDAERAAAEEALKIKLEPQS